MDAEALEAVERLVDQDEGVAASELAGELSYIREFWDGAQEPFEVGTDGPYAKLAAKFAEMGEHAAVAADLLSKIRTSTSPAPGGNL